MCKERLAMYKLCELLEHPKALAATTELVMTNVIRLKIPKMIQWAISSQVSKKLDEGSETRESILNQYDMEKSPRVHSSNDKLDDDIVRTIIKVIDIRIKSLMITKCNNVATYYVRGTITNV